MTQSDDPRPSINGGAATGIDAPPDPATMLESQYLATQGGLRARLQVGDLLARYGLLMLLVAELVVFGVTMPSKFATWPNLQNIFSSQSIILILTLGLCIPILVGEFDASIAGTLGLTMVLMGYLTVLHGWPFVPALVVCLLVGALVGAINAFMVVVIGINSFIATIGMGTALGGLQILLTNSELIPNLPQPLVTAASVSFLGLPLPVYYALGLAVIIWIVLEFMPVGRRLMFVGAGREAARLSGVRVRRLRTGAFVASGGIAGFAGLIYAGQLGTADATAGNAFLLPAFAGAFLGATAIKPGRPNAWGTVVAIYVLVVGVTGLQLLGSGPWVTDVFNGTALMIGVAITKFTAHRTVGLASLS